ncbi:hypothetical protein ACFQHW_10035 [Lapidilactobacillus achengensis]|uniref:Uncharacterized protein n=1 Tax=Lapidilactobacillus achengensis TaxID=2486000 RepID=A0ABW1US51_9LACO
MTIARPVGVSAQTAVITLSGWSGEIRGEIAVKLSLAALPLRTRPDFETSRVLCGLAQNSAHSELTPNFAAQAAGTLLLRLSQPTLWPRYFYQTLPDIFPAVIA